MKTHTVVFTTLIILVSIGIFVAGCVETQSPIVSLDDNEFIGTWTVTGTFLADGELCDVAFTFKADGTGIRELISPTTGKVVQGEYFSWKRTGEFDNVKITYDDGYEEITSLGWLKGTW